MISYDTMLTCNRAKVLSYELLWHGVYTGTSFVWCGPL